MAIKKELIQFTISNETDCSINLPLFQQNVYSINATTKYSWDITSEVLACGTGTIVVNGVTLTLNFTPTLTGLLNALNALGFGFFCTETIGGSTFLYVVDDTNVYGGIDICPSASTTTTTSTTTAPETSTTTTTSTTTAPETSTTTTTSTTTAPETSTTTTTSTTTITQYAVDFRVSELAATGQNIKLWYSTNGGVTWNFYVLANASLYPSYSVYAGLQFPAGTNLLFGITDTSDVNIEYGEGNASGDFISKCGLSNPMSVTNLSAPTSFYTNLNVSGGNFVPCSGTTTTTTTSTTTAAPETTTTTTTSTTTTPETSTTTTTSTTTLFTNLTFDLLSGAGGYTIGAIDVNGATPTLTGGTDVPFSTDTHDYYTSQIGSAETLNITISAFSLIGCITVTDSASNSSSQTITGTGTYSFTGLVIDNLVAVSVLCADNACP